MWGSTLPLGSIARRSSPSSQPDLNRCLPDPGFPRVPHAAKIHGIVPALKLPELRSTFASFKLFSRLRIAACDAKSVNHLSSLLAVPYAALIFLMLSLAVSTICCGVTATITYSDNQ